MGFKSGPDRKSEPDNTPQAKLIPQFIKGLGQFFICRVDIEGGKADQHEENEGTKCSDDTDQVGGGQSADGQPGAQVQ